MQNNRRTALLSSLVMLSASGLGFGLTPRQRRSDQLGSLQLESSIPVNFEGWTMDTLQAATIIDPQTKETIDRTYTATLSRNYVRADGNRIMLSIAYGEELSDTGVGLHYPEVCYPSQGFKVVSARKDILKFNNGEIKIKKLETVYRDTRFEPVLYWTMIGGESHYSGIERKFAEINYGLHGLKADGLLFRISSISKDSDTAFSLQEQFVRDMVKALPKHTLQRLTGLAA